MNIEETNLMEWAKVESVKLKRTQDEIGEGVLISSKREYRSEMLSGFMLRIELLADTEQDFEDD